MDNSFAKALGLALSFSALLGLTACGGSDTQIIERDPVPDEQDHGDDHDDHDDDHAHGDAPQTKGRLVISPYGESEVLVFELDDGEELAHYDTVGEISALNATPDHRFALVMQRESDLVNAIDGGLWSEYHNDHWDYVQTSPSFMDFSVEGPRPTHFTNGGNRSVVFFDGLADEARVAQVSVFSSHEVEDNEADLRLELDTHQHGAAQWMSGYLLSTLRDPSDDSTLPNQVGLYHDHDGELELEQTFEETCPGLHGSAQVEHYVVFGCTDGVLVIHEEAGEFIDSKIANPTDGFEGRIGSLYASGQEPVMLGVASGNLYEIDLSAGEMSPVNWRNSAELEPVAYAFDGEGEHFMVLDADGGLTVLEVADAWHNHGRIEVVTSDLSALAEDQKLAMTASHASHFIYVTDPAGQQVLEVDLESESVSSVLTLDFSPSKIVWLGLENSYHDEHEGEHAH